MLLNYSKKLFYMIRREKQGKKFTKLVNKEAVRDTHEHPSVFMGSMIGEKNPISSSFFCLENAFPHDIRARHLPSESFRQIQ